MSAEQPELFPDPKPEPFDVNKISKHIASHPLGPKPGEDREKQPSEAAIDQGHGLAPPTSDVQRTVSCEDGHRRHQDWRLTKEQVRAAGPGLEAARAAIRRALETDDNE